MTDPLAGFTPMRLQRHVSPRSLLGLLMHLIDQREKLNDRIAGLERRLRDEAGFTGALNCWLDVYDALQSGWNAPPLVRSSDVVRVEDGIQF